MKIFGREPAFWIGLIVTLVLGVVSTLSGEGLISDVAAGRATDLVNSIAQLAVLLAPLITGALIRPATTPVVAPSLPEGTPVLNPADPDGDEPPPDLVVVDRNRLVS